MKLILLAFLCLFLGACTNSPKQGKIKQTTTKIKASTDARKKMREGDLLFYLLTKSFINWQGTPYRLGGNTKRGIDCSAFIKHVYDESFNVSLPRTTKHQSEQGHLVYRDELQIGDLIFFKTGWNIRHVGIYMGNNEFIHASTSKGVTTSLLDNSYWTSKYWQARRIID